MTLSDVVLSPARLEQLREDLRELRELERHEDLVLRGNFRQLDFEQSLSRYRDVLEAVANAHDSR